MYFFIFLMWYSMDSGGVKSWVFSPTHENVWIISLLLHGSPQVVKHLVSSLMTVSEEDIVEWAPNLHEVSNRFSLRRILFLTFLDNKKIMLFYVSGMYYLWVFIQCSGLVKSCTFTDTFSPESKALVVTDHWTIRRPFRSHFSGVLH